MSSLFRKIVLTLAIYQIFFSAVHAQDRAFLGKVVNDKGEAVVGAVITIRNVNTGKTYTTKTVERGEWICNKPKIGNYYIVVRAKGYAPAYDEKLTVGRTTVTFNPLVAGDYSQKLPLETESVRQEIAHPQDQARQIIAQGKSLETESVRQEIAHLQDQARQIIAQGKSLESQGKLLEAREKYNQAYEVWNGKDATKALSALNVASKKKVAPLLDESSKLYVAGKYKESIETLEGANALLPNDPLILYNFAASYYKLEDRRKALEYLDSCERSMGDSPSERRGNPVLPKVAELRVLINSDESVPEMSDAARESIATINNAISAKPAEKPEETTNYTKAELKQQDNVCKLLKDSEFTLPKTSAILFNLAKCAEDDGRFEDAARYFTQYLQVVPKSTDAGNVQLKVSDLVSLIGAKDEKGTELRRYYAQAYRMITARRYSKALEEFQNAEKLAPEYPLPKYKLGLLSQAMGNFAEARQYFLDYFKLEQNESARPAVIQTLANIGYRKAQFDDNVTAAKTKLIDVMQKRNSETRFKDALMEAQKKLQTAVEISPLSAEANALLGFIYMQANNSEAARKSFDVVAGENQPVSFYSTIDAKGKNLPKGYRFAKVEIEFDTIRIILLNEPVPKPKKGDPHFAPTKPAGFGDQLANMGGPSSKFIPSSESGDIIIVPLSVIHSIETQNGTVQLKAEDQRFTFIPSHVLFDVPYEGSEARRFGNSYTRLFSQYLGFENVKLGKESMTFGEKFMVGMMIANAILAPVNAAINSGSTNSTTGIIMASALAATAALDYIQTMRQQQTLLLERMQFKLIPSMPMQLTFRPEDFR